MIGGSIRTLIFLTFSNSILTHQQINSNKTTIMKKIFCTGIILLVLAYSSTAQMDLPPSGGNPRASISEEVGITSITIKYSRPDVNKREGKI